MTGGALRIGRAISLRLAEAGYCVAVHCNTSRAEAEALIEEISSQNGTAVVVRADLSSEAGLKTLVRNAGQETDLPVTVLVNNASVFEADTIEDMSRESWDRHLAVNLYAPLVLAQDMAAGLPDGAHGNIVNLTDQRTRRPTPEFLSYTLSKVGLDHATRLLARALAPQIRVNAIAPGPTLKNSHQTDEEFEAEYAATPLGRGSSPDEIAEAVIYLINCRTITGSTLFLDGGQHLPL